MENPAPPPPKLDLVIDSGSRLAFAKIERIS